MGGEPVRRRRRVRSSGGERAAADALASATPAARAETSGAADRTGDQAADQTSDRTGDQAGGRVPGPEAVNTSQAERGLRGLVGGGSSQISPTAALRARDAARPRAADLARAEQDLVIIRRNWTPRD